MAGIKVTALDTEGVVVDTSPLAETPGTLVKASNAIPDPTGELGVIVKRPGWKRFIESAMSGIVRGGIAVPFALGSAGPSIANPFTDITLTLTSLITSFTAQTADENTVDLGPTFNDESDFFQWDWVEDFDEDEAEQILDGFDENDLFLIEDEEGVDGTAESSSVFPLVFVGDGFDDTPGLAVFSKVEATDAFDKANVPTDIGIKLTPDEYIRGEDEGMANLIANSPMMGAIVGKPYCTFDGKLYYAEGGYTVGTDFPAIRVYDGYTDEIVCQMPANPDVGASTPPNTIMWMIAANNRIYVNTFDGGTNNTGGGTVKGSVYELNPSTSALTKLGATFPTGHQPYPLLWAYGRLWCGTMVNSDGDTTPARVYWIRPGIDSAWTLDKTFANDLHIVTGLDVFKGLIYASLHGDKVTVGGVQVRSVAGTWSSSDSETNYEYLNLIAWPEANAQVASPAQALYAVSYKNDGTSKHVRRFDGSSWSTALASTHEDIGESFSSTYVISGNAIKPALWLSNDVADDGHAYNTTNGTSWTKRTITLTGSGTVQNEVIYGLLVQV